MRFTEEHFESWLDLVCSGDDERAEARLRLQPRVADPEWRSRRFVAIEEGRVRAVATLLSVGKDQLALTCPRTRGQDAIEEADAALVPEAVAVARSWGARLGARFPVDRASPALIEACERSGGQRQVDRVEFKTPVDELPRTDDRGPLVWRGADDLPYAAALFRRCASGSPDGLEEDEDSLETLEGYLRNPETRSDPAACLHVGRLDDEDVALVCAQVNPSDGWCTVTYFGLVPEVRGRGLGNHAHRHAIGMLRAQGGQLYHGGTSWDNAPMRACFARQGCREWKVLQVWRWD